MFSEDHAILKKNTDEFLEQQGFQRHVRAGLEAIAGIKASVYSHGKEPDEKILQEFRYHEIVKCLMGVDMADEETLEALEAGLEMEVIERQADEEKDRLLKQAEWVGLALKSSGHLMFQTLEVD